MNLPTAVLIGGLAPILLMIALESGLQTAGIVVGLGLIALLVLVWVQG